MATYLDNRLISVNSKNGTRKNDSYNSDVVFNFQGILKEDKSIINTEIELINAQIPVSFYSINYTNNVLTYTLDSTKTFTLTRGNYSSSQLIQTLRNAFISNGDIFTITISSISGILTFSSNSQFTFEYNQSTMMNLLGFNQSITSSQNVIIAPFPLNLVSITSLNVTSNALACYNYSSNGGLTNSVMILNVDKPQWGVITFQSQNKQSKLLRNKIIDSIDIQIKDQNGNFINFNNLDWSLTFSIQILRLLPIYSNLDFHHILSNENTKLLGRKEDKIPLENTDDELNLLSS